ncbi:MAG TPA: DNA gyrase inhibitor YacG [Terriglobia bacterium]|nr:DNA gyrase inhibitor YacG [Terriglobia bacterium]
MRCPTCKGETTFKSNPFRPFCSERCKMIDLDNWLSGRYRISTPIDRREEAVKSEGSADNELGDSSGSE